MRDNSTAVAKAEIENRQWRWRNECSCIPAATT